MQVVAHASNLVLASFRKDDRKAMSVNAMGRDGKGGTVLQENTGCQFRQEHIGDVFAYGDEVLFLKGVVVTCYRSRKCAVFGKEQEPLAFFVEPPDHMKVCTLGEEIKNTGSLRLCARRADTARL